MEIQHAFAVVKYLVIPLLLVVIWIFRHKIEKFVEYLFGIKVLSSIDEHFKLSLPQKIVVIIGIMLASVLAIVILSLWLILDACRYLFDKKNREQNPS